eukprot:CAMPEP_0119046222 /NCGR_PEP_ID=MMETSP1177-20130426/45209_1 /TAXON_ID=2985 /ORGANISM="Ochromonas sp, Strain CCMP1899" /LENGTH=126 /DNA_ID=CAMNT_0007019079 /DNA_START=103 /DNA_END=483 /DNA_ORIENTATION=-
MRLPILGFLGINLIGWWLAEAISENENSAPTAANPPANGDQSLLLGKFLPKPPISDWGNTDAAGEVPMASGDNIESAKNKKSDLGVLGDNPALSGDPAMPAPVYEKGLGDGSGSIAIPQFGPAGGP